MRRSSGPRRLADLVPACVGPAAAERGFAAAELVSRWRDIAGPEIGAHSRPLRFGWPPRGRATDPTAAPAGAVLYLRVESGFALALQYQSEALIGRINAYLGWRCVEALRFKQGPLGPANGRAPASARLPAEADEALAARLKGLDDALAEPLRRLGREVLSRKTPPS